MGEPITSLIADDPTMFHQGLRELLERKGGFKVVDEMSDGFAAVELAHQLEPVIVAV